MFERFTKDARAVVSGAVEHAVRSGAALVDTEHVLLALLDRKSGRAFLALTALGARERRDSIAAALAEARRRAGLSQADAEALAGLGIDLSELISRVEEVHGVGAMAADSGRGRGESRGEKGRLTGHRPFAPGAKDTLTRALGIAVSRHDRHIGDEHLLLALLVRPGVANEALTAHGVTYTAVEGALYGAGSQGEEGSKAG